jgi:Reverse transcriptase (RNA-dependent DNA polymerase)/Endonuclease-reverse transcriptase
MAYARKRSQDDHDTPLFTVGPRTDIANHPCLQVLDIILDNEQWRVINVYHDARDISGLNMLLNIDISATTPTLIIGDFNTHSPSWSPPDTPRSHWAGRLEEWAAINLLTLANNPGEITRRGAEHERDAVIDLAWYNEAAIQRGTFSGLTIDWQGSLGSDHALLSVSGRPNDHGHAHMPEDDLGLVTDPERRGDWIRAFKTLPAALPLPHTPTVEDVEMAATALTEAIQLTNEQVFRKRRPFHRRASPWWNAACALAVQELRDAQDRATKKIAQARLKGIIRTAKRCWADGYIEKAQLWEVAAWRHGRRVSKVPPLRGPEGIAHSHEEIADILSHRFFAVNPPQVLPNFPDDPPPRLTRALPPFDKDTIGQLLSKTDNRSAPGQSGHSWTIIKWAWEADSTRIANVLTACLQAGHHPRLWKEATVCVIPKAGRADYTLAKNFRPISLLECLGKLLEKLVAKLIYRDMTKYSLVPTTQFGGRNSSSTLDAGLTLVHDIQSAHHGGLRTGLLLFDIQGYFDHVNHERLVALVANLGFAPELVNWCRSFLKDRTVRLRFNGRTSDPFDFDVGTPQGSPVSPVLSTIYTSPLLHIMGERNRTSLSMYIDDGAIFACGRDWSEIATAMQAGYLTCVEWLARAGLDVEPDKSELIFFRKRKERSDPPAHIHLPLPSYNTYYQVQTANTLRYLGFYFDTRLNWTHHVDIMCNRARASIKALQLLGNSVRGLDHARWKLAYNAICLPVLTYGCQLWYKGKQVTLVKKLQLVQNDAVKVISGTFRTTPREPLHQLLNIFPMDLRLSLHTQNTALRLYKLPRDSQLLIRLGDGWHTPSPNEPTLPTPNNRRAKTSLHALAARVQANGPRIEPFPELPAGAPSWNGRVQVLPKRDKREYEGITRAFVDSCRIGTTINVHCEGFLSNRGRADGKQLGAASVVLYRQGREQTHAEQTFGDSVTEADASLRAFRLGLDTLADTLSTQAPTTHTTIMLFTSSTTALGKALDADPHEEQSTSLKCMERIDEILRLHPVTDFRLSWLPKTAPFVGYKRARQLALEAIRVAEPTTAEDAEPRTIRKQREESKAAAVDAWAERWHQSHRTSLAYRTALTRPPDGKPHPTFIVPPTEQAQGPTAEEPNHGTQGPGEPRAKKAKFSRKTFATFYRIITGHAFIGAYTQRFFPQHTPDQVACPCGEPIQTVEHVLLHCPIYNAPRRKHLTANGHPRNLTQLFTNPKRAVQMLGFLEETGACATPRAAWEPG